MANFYTTYNKVHGRAGHRQVAGSHGRRSAHKRGKALYMWVTICGFAGDALAIYLAIHLAFVVRFYTPVRELGVSTHGMPWEKYHGHFVFMSITLILALFHFGLYSMPEHPRRLRKINAIIFTSCLVWFLANFALSFHLYAQTIISRIYLLLAWGATCSALLAWRWVFDRALGFAPVARALQRRVLFVGWDRNALKLAEQIRVDAKHPHDIVGCVPSDSTGYSLAPPGWISDLQQESSLEELLSDLAVDIVIVNDLHLTREELLALVTLCEKEMVHLQIMPSAFQALVSGLHLETISGVPVLGISKLPLDSPWNQLLKRLIDIVGACVGLVLSTPIIAVFGLMVYLESPGPVFYRQRRMGYNGKNFFIVKIRSMHLNAEASGQPGWTRKDDQRRLKIGALMRSLNIDEVPQFWNVLLGDMSLVGPRPERPELIARFKEEIPHYNARHGIKPGITGWAQVNGLRGDTDLTDRIKYDLYYMENWNVLLEFQILLMTLVTRRNAC